MSIAQIQKTLEAGLYIIPTPIGNLADITLRALTVLQQVDVVLAEDTRVSAKLLKHYEINTPMMGFHMHNEHRKLGGIIRELQGGKTMGLISDAGTPGISDPGFLLLREALKEEIPVFCLPGPTALIPALVQSGLPCDRFVFEGFLPPKKGRQKKIESLAEEARTIVLYESPHKLEKTLTQLAVAFGEDREVAVVRELTKLFEENFRGALKSAIVHFAKHTPKGEFVLVIGGKK